MRSRPTACIPALIALLVLVPGLTVAEDLSGYDGAQLFKRLCASCHGPAGAGDGPVAAGFKTHLPDLTGIAARRGGQFPEDRIRQIIDGRAGVAAHGAREMPVWGNDLRAAGADPELVITRLLAQLRGMQKPGRP
jgi:mono/diheme cytochrome c family protein